MVRLCVAPLATKLYHTSLAVAMLPQLAEGGRLWLARASVPLTTALQAVFTGKETAPAQLSLAGGLNVTAHMAMGPKALLPNSQTRTYSTSPGVRPLTVSRE